MVKGVETSLIYNEATSIKEWIVLPRYTTKDCTPDRIDVSQTIKGIFFKYPLMAASMSCLYHKEKIDLALAASKEGIVPAIHCNQSIEDQADMIKEFKKQKVGQGEIHIIENPILIDSDRPLREAIDMVNAYGHSVIPAKDKFMKLKGVFIRPFYDPPHDPSTPIEKLPEPFYYSKEKLITCNENCSKAEIKQQINRIKGMKGKEGQWKQIFLPILNKEGAITKLAFLQEYPAYFCFAAISTHSDWEKRVEACLKAGADGIVVDTSDGYSEFMLDVLKGFRKRFGWDIPLVGGNWITVEGFDKFAEYVDFAKIGMMTGHACKTGMVKNIGRPLFEAMKNIRIARDKYYKKRGKYVYLIADGGVKDPAAMLISLKFCDIIMAGAYFASFYESAGRAFNDNGKEVQKEDYIMFKEYWGEGSNRAKNLKRYGYKSARTSLEEGVDALIPYRGRLKPCVEEDFKAVKATMSNSGCKNLKEFRENAVLQRLSAEGLKEKYPDSSLKIVK